MPPAQAYPDPLVSSHEDRLQRVESTVSEMNVNVVEQAANIKALTDRLSDREEMLMQTLASRDETMSASMKTGFDAVQSAVEPLAAQVKQMAGEHQDLMKRAADASQQKIQLALKKQKLVKGGASLFMAGAGAVAAKLGPVFWDWLTR